MTASSYDLVSGTSRTSEAHDLVHGCLELRRRSPAVVWDHAVGPVVSAATGMGRSVC